MLVGYVSDERYVALPDVLLEFEGEPGVFAARSGASGSVRLRPARRDLHVDAPEAGLRGQARAARPGPTDRAPCQFRLLSDGLLGYAWPKWVQGGREVRVPRPLRRAVQARALAVRAGEGARPAAWAGSTSTAQGHDADHARRRLHADRRRLEQVRLHQPLLHQYVEAPPGPGSITSSQDRPGGASSPSPGSSRPQQPTAPDRRPGLEHHLERVQQLRRPQQLHQPRPAARDPDRQRPAGAQAVHRSRGNHLRHRRLCPALLRPARADQPHRLRTRKSPTRSRAGPRATSPRPSGGCSAGSSASSSPTTTTPRPSCTTARSTSTSTRF